MTHQRRSPRKETVAKIKISWKANGRGMNEWGMVQDKSEGGLGIRFPTPIEVGSIIALAQGFTTSFAVVRHCSKIRNQFFIGVEFCELQEGTKPIPSWQQQHALTKQEEEQKPEQSADLVAPDSHAEAGTAPTPDAKPETPSTSTPDLKPSKFREDFAMLRPPPKKL